MAEKKEDARPSRRPRRQGEGASRPKARRRRRRRPQAAEGGRRQGAGRGRRRRSARPSDGRQVVNAENEKVARRRAASRRSSACSVNEHLLYEAVKQYRAGGRRGHPHDQEPRPRLRLGQEALAAEGHRPRPRRRDPHPALAARRHGVRAPAPRLLLPMPKKARAAALRSAPQPAREGGRRSRWSTASTSTQPKTKALKGILDQLGVDGQDAARGPRAGRQPGPLGPQHPGREGGRPHRR